ncbi:hypothetical protein [Cupriavidus basilensis]|uniref:hypothetical protein n=1 Tax=Cupriavidus basilensis TaxID=68895 RepID=UPI0023E8BF3A|nr:hypothetical protein [Cupriavidus basilensis]MDF3883697.1 hypothetical protein [Cupriavidus basilensis]
MTIQSNRYSELHDAELVSVTHKRKEKKISICVVCPDDSEVTLNLHDVKTVRMVDFISQNVISRVLHSGSINLDISDLEKMVVWANSLSDGTCLISRESVSDYVSEIKNGTLRLLAIEPSWGAELICIYATE